MAGIFKNLLRTVFKEDRHSLLFKTNKKHLKSLDLFELKREIKFMFLEANHLFQIQQSLFRCEVTLSFCISIHN